MRTLIFSEQVPKNMTEGYVRKALNKVSDVPLKETRDKLKYITSRMYTKRARVESTDEEKTRWVEELEKVNEEKEMFRAIERVRDLEFV